MKVQDVECEVFHTFARWSHNTQAKYRHLRYAPYSAPGDFEDMKILHFDWSAANCSFICCC